MAEEPIEDGRVRLGQFLRERRAELGLSVRAAAELAEVDRGTWTSSESGARRTQDHNFAGIERALRWAPGSVKAILRGGEPTVDRSPATPADRTRSSEQLIKDIWADPDMDGDEKMRLIELITRADAQKAAAEAQLRIAEERLRESREHRRRAS